MRIIDAHQHFWKYDPAKHTWITEKLAPVRKDFLPKDLLPVLRKHQVEGCIAVQVEHNEEETNFLLQCASDHSFIKGVVGWADLTAKNIRERLEYYSRFREFKGIRHTEYDHRGEFLLGRAFQNGLKQLQKFGYRFELLIFPYQLASALELVKAFPDQLFVLNHLAKPRMGDGPADDWKKFMTQLGKSENVYAKLSGMVTPAEDY